MIYNTYLILPVLLHNEPRLQDGGQVGVVACRPHSPEFDYMLITTFDDAALPAVRVLCDELETYKLRLPFESAEYAYSRFMALSIRREGLVHFGEIQTVEDYSLQSAMHSAFSGMQIT